jgi:hypothetical protein
MIRNPHVRRLVLPVVAATLMLCACSTGTPAKTVTMTVTETKTVSATSVSAVASAAPSASSTPAPATPTSLTASGLLAGPARPTSSSGDPGKVSVVDQGPLDRQSGSATLSFVFRNNTAAAISHVDVSASARNHAGQLIATGTSQGTTPAQIQPGQLSMAFIYFEHANKIPTNASYSFEFETSPADTESFNTADLKATEASVSGGAIVGAGVNSSGKTVSGPFAVNAYCFRGDHVLTNVNGFTDQDSDQRPGGKVTFTLDLYGGNCRDFLVGITGYYS